MTIEIRGFLESSLLDWDGKISSVIFLPGCNFKCPFCHNYPLVYEPETLKKYNFEDIKKYLIEHKNWIDGVVVSGGEPTIYRELENFIEIIKDLGFAVKLDTNGTNPKMLKDLIKRKLVDLYAMDIKGPLNEKYASLAGCKVDLKKIKESIALLMHSKVNYEFRTTIVPGLLDTEDIKELSKTIENAKSFVLQQFQPGNAYDESLRNKKPYPKEKLLEMVEAAKVHVANTVLRGV